MEGLELVELITLSAALLALVLAAGAAWLAMRCYRITLETAAQTTEAARTVAASTDKLKQVLSAISAHGFSEHHAAVTETEKDCQAAVR